MELKDVVQPLSEYTPKFADADTVPLEGKFKFALRAAKVVTVKATPIRTKATTAIDIESLRFTIFCCPNKSDLCRKS